MNREEAAWCGGLFEGEGSMYLNKGRQPMASLAMTDEDTVRRFHRLVGFGAVYAKKVRKPRYKPAWTWQTSRAETVQALIAYIWPWLGARRQVRAREVLKGASQIFGRGLKKHA